MKSLTTALSAACLAGASSFSIAQQATPLPPVDVYTSTSPGPQSGPPLSGDSVSRDELRSAQASSSDTGSLLSRIPGVASNTGGGFSGMPTVRGLGEQRLGITVDGHPIDSACPNDMNTPLSYTDPQTVAGIRVITGVSPVSLGGDSIGAVISVNGPAPRFAADGKTLLGGEASAFYRSNGDAFGNALLLTAASRRFSATYSGSYVRSGNYSGGSGLGTVHASEYSKTDHAIALAWQGALGLLELKGGYHFSPYEGFVNQYMDMTFNRSSFVNGHYHNELGWGTVDLKTDYRATDHEMNFLVDKGGTANGGMPMNTRVRSWGYNLQFDVPTGAGQALRLGNDYHGQKLDDWWPAVPGSMMMGPDTYVNINDGHRNRLGVFAELASTWSPRLSSIVGARFDRVSMDAGQVQPYGTDMMNMDDAMAAMAFNMVDHQRTDNDWSASALASYAPNRAVTVELGLAHKTRAPNLYERYSWGRGAMSSSMIGWFGDGNGYVGNLALEPERADTASIAIDLHSADPAGWRIRIEPYYTHVDDYIDAVYVQDFTDMMGMPTGFGQLQFANQQARFYGLDLSGSALLWDGGTAGRTQVSASLGILHGENLSTGTPLYHQQPLTAKLGLNHARGALEGGFDLEWADAKTRVDPARREPPTASYALLNLHGAYTWSATRLSLDVENLLDRAYALPLGGISLGDYIAGGPTALRAVPGRGRSINLGVSVRF